MNHEAYLHTLFVAMLAYAQENLRGKFTPDQIRAAARAAIDDMQLSEMAPSWDGAPTLSVREAKRQCRLYCPISVLARVTSISEQMVATIPTDDESGETQQDAILVSVTGTDGEKLELLPILGERLVGILQDAHRSSAGVRIQGVMISVPTKMTPQGGSSSMRLYALHVLDVSVSGSAMDLLGATQAERDATEQLAQDLAASGETPYEFLLGRVMENLGVVDGDEPVSELFDAIRFTILQALSTGFVGHAPARLHIVLVGPPGQGKKLAALAARALNPVSLEASASKISAAGLVAASRRTSGGWVSEPGLLPLASEGVLVVQDAHAWGAPTFAKIAPILYEVIEDGVVRDSVAGGSRRVARTSLVIDSNRLRQVHQLGSGGEATILTNVPLLSRLDTVIEIPLDVDRAWRVGGAMYGSFTEHGNQDLDAQPWVREVRLLVAYLRDRHPMIDCSGVTEELRAAHEEIRKANELFLKTSPNDASAIPIRMAISMTRLVMASARAHDRAAAMTEDVEVALIYVRRKLEFMKMATAGPVSDGPDVRRTRRAAYYARYAGQTVTSAQVEADLKNDGIDEADNRTVRRDLAELGATRKGKNWTLP